ncbi:phosphotransferase [Nocardia sp. NPDC051911]|uniref:phosphotransferase n=1 Tax=Nocardia sp. NPDC051911 TaxID=3154648 RepID=UPI00342B8B9B
MEAAAQLPGGSPVLPQSHPRDPRAHRPPPSRPLTTGTARPGRCGAPSSTAAGQTSGAELEVVVREGMLSGVLDFGALGAGDPATDLAAAWLILPVGKSTRFFDAYSATAASRCRNVT